jgi:hypothetical protein
VFTTLKATGQLGAELQAVDPKSMEARTSMQGAYEVLVDEVEVIYR